ncbi:MAG: histidine kinase [Salinivirgaceae bacterium]|nr:histidine kinase [Salinivirgaceae bacterium]
MDTNIFGTKDSDRRVARRRHLFTLITAILVSYTVWSLIEVWGGDYGTYQRGIGEIIADFMTSAVETVILMEISFLICKMVIRAFRNTQYSTLILLFQNLILLASVIITAGALSYISHLFYWNELVFSWESFLCYSLVAFFITSVLFTSFLTNRYRDEAEKALKTELQLKEEKALTLQMSVEKLKLKTDNHFVFNSLATLGNLIMTDTQAAADFCNSMSRMYRYIVTKGDAVTVPVSQELAFTEEYAKNITLRYSNVNISIDPALRQTDMLIPPLSLQSLLENAIKHNSHTADKPLEISVSRTDDSIVVSNNLNPLKSSITTTGTGLKTLHDRYSMIYGKEITVVKTETCFSVQLPLIPNDYESSDN